MPSRGCCARPLASRILTGRPPAIECATRLPDADPEDLVLFDDLLGIADPDAALPAIDPDARRRRLTALVNAASLARETPAVYVVEDAHWIDEVSESMLAEFLTVIPQTPSLVLVTYRPEYRGALTQVPGAQTIALAPLSDSETAALVSELLGPDPSVGGLGQTIAERAAGNPFFAEEIVRELAERGVLHGERGAYISTAEVAEVECACHVAGDHRRAHRSASTRSETHVERGGGHRVAVQPGPADTARRRTRRCRPGGGPVHRSGQIHPPTRVCVPPSADSRGGLRGSAQVGSRRDAPAARRRHRSNATTTSVGENAALIAEHLEAAGDLRSAYAWHMRAGAWSSNRDIRAARISWERARRVADALPANDPERTAMRIRPENGAVYDARGVSGWASPTPVSTSFVGCAPALAMTSRWRSGCTGKW